MGVQAYLEWEGIAPVLLTQLDPEEAVVEELRCWEVEAEL